MDGLWRILKIDPLDEGQQVILDGISYRFRKGILRQQTHTSSRQNQSRDIFAHKWDKQETYESTNMKKETGMWLRNRYGDIRSLFAAPLNSDFMFLDAGCGSGYTTLELFPLDILSKLTYIGVDISFAVDVAKKRFEERNIHASFLQADINRLPFDKNSMDLIYSEGVLHHTDSTQKAIFHLSALLKPGGYFLFYVYNKKGPIREFTDDYIRDQLKSLPPEEAWSALTELTKLGKILGDLNIEVDIENDIPLLQIEKGKINLQRFIYWHVFKAYYRPDMTLDEMLHVNFDWYAPRNAHRQTPEEVRKWCGESGLEIQSEKVERSGITIVAQKKQDYR